MFESFIPGLVAWLATYALHSTVLSVLALVFLRWIENDAWRHTLLSTALFAAIVTSTLAPLGPGRVVSLASGGPRTVVTATDAFEALRASGQAGFRHDGKRLLVTGWALVAFGLVGRRLFLVAVLRRRLADEVQAMEGSGDGMSAPGAGGIPIYVLDRDGSPFSWGKRIYVPHRPFSLLPRSQQAAVLAHEAAHVVRRDGWRFGAALFVQDLFFFQPLHRVVRRQLVHTAERLCDQWAIARGSDPLALAHALTRMARFSTVRSFHPAAAGGKLSARVRALLHGPAAAPSSCPWSRWVIATLLVLVVTSFVPHAAAIHTAPLAGKVEHWQGVLAERRARLEAASTQVPSTVVRTELAAAVETLEEAMATLAAAERTLRTERDAPMQSERSHP